MRRAAAVIAIVAGAVLVALPFAYSMFDRTSDAERILDRFPFLTLDGNPQRYLDEAVVTRDGSSELVDSALSGLAAEAGVSQGQLDERAPALVEARETIPDAREFSVRYSDQLEAVKGKFQAVYDIPVPWLPLTAVPYLFIAAGLSSLALGVAALRSPSNGPLIALAALGLLIVIGTAAFGGISKASDAEDVKDFAENGLTDRAATAAKSASAALDELAAETDESTLPFLASARGVQVETERKELADGYPDAALFLTEWDELGPKLSRLADAVSVSVAEFDDAKKLPIEFPVWALLAGGLAIAASAGVAVATRPEG